MKETGKARSRIYAAWMVNSMFFCQFLGVCACGKENPVGTVRVEEPELEKARVLPMPFIRTIYWSLLVPGRVTPDDPMRWMAKLDVRLSGSLNQDVIDGLSHYEIFTAPSGYRPGETYEHRPGTRFNYPDRFRNGTPHFHRPQQWTVDGIVLEEDRRCFDIEIRAIAMPGSGWNDSPAFTSYMFYYIDHSHGFYNPVQPRCIGRDWASNETTRWFSVRGPNRTHVMRNEPHTQHFEEPTQ